MIAKRKFYRMNMNIYFSSKRTLCDRFLMCHDCTSLRHNSHIQVCYIFFQKGLDKNYFNTQHPNRIV